MCVEYVERVVRALNSVGITEVVRLDYSSDLGARDALADLRARLHVPGEFFGSVTSVVDGRYVFEGYFPTDVMMSFVSSNMAYDHLIAAEGLSSDTYRLRRGDTMIECGSFQKIQDCLSGDTFPGTLGIWTLVLVSGFLNGLNPCGLAVLAYFVGVISINRSRREVLKIGVFYILSILFVYLGIGIGFMHVILSSGYVDIVSTVLRTIVIAVSIISLKDVFQHSSTPRIKLALGVLLLLRHAR